MTSLEKIRFGENQKNPDLFLNMKPQSISKGKGDRKKSKILSFQSSWMRQYKWLTYSHILDGGLCTCCVFFPQKSLKSNNTFVIWKRNLPSQNMKIPSTIICQDSTIKRPNPFLSGPHPPYHTKRLKMKPLTFTSILYEIQIRTHN